MFDKLTLLFKEALLLTHLVIKFYFYIICVPVGFATGIWITSQQLSLMDVPSWCYHVVSKRFIKEPAHHLLLTRANWYSFVSQLISSVNRKAHVKELWCNSFLGPISIFTQTPNLNPTSNSDDWNGGMVTQYCGFPAGVWTSPELTGGWIFSPVRRFNDRRVTLIWHFCFSDQFKFKYLIYIIYYNNIELN